MNTSTTKKTITTKKAITTNVEISPIIEAELNKLDFLIYSTHKTSTQTITNTLLTNNIRAKHIHILDDLYKKPNSYQLFINHLKSYQAKNGRRLKIITIIRNPFERLISSFFQYYHNRQNKHTKCGEKNTLIMKNNVNRLRAIFLNKLNKKETELHYYLESINEMSQIFKTNIVRNLVNKEDHFTYENDLMQLYVLDFTKIIGSPNASSVCGIYYINNILGTHFQNLVPENLTKNKITYPKYMKFKRLLENDQKIKDKIKSFYSEQDIPFFYKFNIGSEPQSVLN